MVCSFKEGVLLKMFKWFTHRILKFIENVYGKTAIAIIENDLKETLHQNGYWMKGLKA